MIFLKQLTKRVLKYEAELILKKYKPKIIAIMGDVGKTSTKEAIYLVLSKKFFVRKSEKSFTTELGVPLTIIGCSKGTGSILEWLRNIIFGLILLIHKENYPKYILLELDSDKPDDLKGISQWLKVDILVMTAIGEIPSHVETFSSLEEFNNEKRYVVSSVNRNGIIVYNSDKKINANLLLDNNLRKISCGLESNSDIFGSDFHITYAKNKSGEVPTGMSFDIEYKGEKYPVVIFQSIGIHNEYASLLAFAVGTELGISPKEIAGVLRKLKSLPGRMNIISGIKDTVIIDDSYNASPVGMSQAIDVLRNTKSAGKKIAVLGDMLELGKYSSGEHKKLAELLKEVVSKVIFVGFRMQKASEALLDLGFSELNIVSFDAPVEAGIELQRTLQIGDIVLVKGSQGMRMERVVEEVMRHPEDKEKLLVRQEKEWLIR